MKQKIKNTALVVLLFVSAFVLFYTLAVFVVVIAAPFQTTQPGYTGLEELARYFFAHKGQYLASLIIPSVILYLLVGPIKEFYRRNIEKKLEILIEKIFQD